MKRFAVACALALAAVFLASGCNDYGNTFQGNTGASLVSISPSIVNAGGASPITLTRSEEHTSELQSLTNLVCRLLLEKKKKLKLTGFLNVDYECVTHPVGVACNLEA